MSEYTKSNGSQSEVNASELRLPGLEGKRVVITAGAGGIGLAIANLLHQQGARLAICDVDNRALEDARAKLDNCIFMEADVSNDAQVDRFFDKVHDQMDGLDALVNNAGIAGPTEPSWEYALEDWRRVIDVDLNAVYYCCRAVVPRMREQNYGRIVNVASIAGKEGNPNAAAYSAAKAGVIALTKSIAKETAEKNISVNCITPAAARTRIFDQISQQHIDYMLSKIPRGRFVQVEEIAAMVTWLVSEENSFTTGGVFDLSGGRATY